MWHFPVTLQRHFSWNLSSDTDRWMSKGNFWPVLRLSLPTEGNSVGINSNFMTLSVSHRSSCLPIGNHESTSHVIFSSESLAMRAHVLLFLTKFCRFFLRCYFIDITYRHFSDCLMVTQKTLHQLRYFLLFTTWAVFRALTFKVEIANNSVLRIISKLSHLFLSDGPFFLLLIVFAEV